MRGSRRPGGTWTAGRWALAWQRRAWPQACRPRGRPLQRPPPPRLQTGQALQEVGRSGSQTVGRPQSRWMFQAQNQLTCDYSCAPHECCDLSASTSDRARRVKILGLGPCNHCREWPLLPVRCEEGPQQFPCHTPPCCCQDYAPAFVMSASSAAGVAFREVRRERSGAGAASSATSAVGAQRRAARVAALATSGSPAAYQGASISTRACRTALAQEPPS